MLRVAVLLLLAILVPTDCTADDTPSDQSETTRDPISSGLLEGASPTPRPVIIGDVRWPTLNGQSVQMLFEQYDGVAVGKVIGVALPYDPQPGYLGWTPSSCDIPPDHPKYSLCSWTPSPEELSRPPGKGFTVFQIEVHRAIGRSPPSAGQTVLVGQGGGVSEGVEYRLEGSPVLQVGNTYLLAIEASTDVQEATAQPGYWAGVPFGRFSIDPGGRLQAVDNMWLILPAVQELSGLTIDEAFSTIQEALGSTEASSS